MKNDINRMLDEHLSKKHFEQRMRLREKKREELYKIEKEDLPKDAIIIPTKNAKSFMFGAVATVLIFAVAGMVFAATSFGEQIVSSVATGTAPFSVASTTKVTNLNADTLDGIDSSALQDLPASWTCTVRSNTSTDCGSNCYASATASCSGSEKAISGGCGLGAGVVWTDAGGYMNGPDSNYPTGQGWFCSGYSGNGILTAYTNCCS